MNFEIKGLDALMKGLAVLAGQPSAPPFRLLVAGKGNVRKYRALAASLGIDRQVTFAGVLSRADLPSVFAAADLYAMLSRFDTFGMVVLEAMAASLPVLVSDRVGAKDLVRDGGNGFVLPAGAGPEETARTLAFLLREETPGADGAGGPGRRLGTIPGTRPPRVSRRSTRKSRAAERKGNDAMDLSLIIVSYNTAALTCDCLHSVMAAAGQKREVFVVDNASTDSSAGIIQARFPSIRLIANPKNRGFSAANNQRRFPLPGTLSLLPQPGYTGQTRRL